MNTTDFLRLGVPLGQATCLASAFAALRRDKPDSVSRFIFGGGATGARTSVRFNARSWEALEISAAFDGRELKRRERRAPDVFEIMRGATKISALVTSAPTSERGKFPARLHVLLAREAKVGLVIRRGPSKSVCTVLWNRERNTFKLGQWMGNGKLSGEKLLYDFNAMRFEAITAPY